MNDPVPYSPWTRRRFWSVAGALFVLQAGLILVFAERDRGGQRGTTGPAYFRVLGTPLTADELSEAFFAADPTVFSLPGAHGFSERAWLHLPPGQYETPNETETPAWLAINSSRLGTNFPQLSRPQSPLPFGLADPDSAELEPWPGFLAPEQFRSQSRFEIQGELSRRKLNTPVELRAWPPGPNGPLLSQSVVQIAVNSAGQVVAARLLGHSGSVDADASALHTARNLRFHPVPASPPIWGEALFQWQTASSSNAAPSGPP